MAYFKQFKCQKLKKSQNNNTLTHLKSVNVSIIGRAAIVLDIY